MLLPGTGAPTFMNGSEMMALAGQLFPICRSITGPGLRESLDILAGHIPLELTEIPSGTQVLDWEIPDEWTIRDAWIADATGRRILDFRQNNLHVVQYSEPFRGKMSLPELQSHLFSLPDVPLAIPYRTSYYQRSWGFCLNQKERDALAAGEYEVCIDSTLAPGSLTLGEYFLPGESEGEILVSAHCCHPSLANDNLSGMVVALAAARHFAEKGRRLGLRFLFAPGTIGAIAWLARNQARTGDIRHGFVLTGLGMDSPLRYKKTRDGHLEVDQAVAQVLKDRALPDTSLDFSPYGYDERQFNSPGFALPVGCLMRAPFGTYPEYHTSLDNLSFIHPEKLEEALAFLIQAIDVLQENLTYRNLLPFGEPQLGRRGLYASTPQENLARLWVLNLSDGRHSLLDIARRSEMPFANIAEAASFLALGRVLEPT